MGLTQPGVWWAGTSPHGLFRSEDGGVTWSGVEGFNRDLVARIGTIGQDTPDGAVTHSILVDPRDPKHLYVGPSGGGSLESRDGGESWRALNRGVAADFLPDKDPEIGHDPHIMALHPLKPDRLYQQNHCGIYRLDRPGNVWTRIGTNMPKAVGDIGFPLLLHPRDPDTLWVIPMDGSTVWPRTSPGGKPAVYRSRNAGKSWERQDSRLPRAQAWLTVKRQAFAGDGGKPLGLSFGTTGGEIWMSTDEGKRCRFIPTRVGAAKSKPRALPSPRCWPIWTGAFPVSASASWTSRTASGSTCASTWAPSPPLPPTSRSRRARRSTSSRRSAAEPRIP